MSRITAGALQRCNIRTVVVDGVADTKEDQDGRHDGRTALRVSYPIPYHEQSIRAVPIPRSFPLTSAILPSLSHTVLPVPYTLMLLYRPRRGR